METQQLRYRMYGLVPYNLSPIQQGIQFSHALQEYNNNISRDNRVKYSDEVEDVIKAFEAWALRDKTVIILNGGTTSNALLKPSELGVDKSLIYKGSLNNYGIQLSNNGVVIARFYEPDLNDALTAVTFLVDERVWDKEKYPDYYPFSMLNTIVPDPHYEDWVYRVGGERNVFLRNFLKQFRLA